MSDAKRRYHWDKRSKKYVLRGTEDTQRKGRKVRNEAGKVVQVGGEDGRDGWGRGWGEQAVIALGTDVGEG